MKEKKIDIPIYGGSLIIIKADNLQPIVDKHDFKIDASKYGAFTFSKYVDDVLRCYMVFGNDPCPSLIAHESVHAVNFIYENIGAKLDIINDEPQAYLTGWVFEQCYKFLTKK